MTSTADSPLPNDVATLQTMLLSERAARMAAESEAKFRALLIEKLKYTIAKLRHDKFGQSSERGAILEQLELSLADLEEDASAAATAAQMAAAQAKIEVRSFERRKPARRPLPEHLPRERIVYPAPASCPCCGGVLHKIGEDVTETLELIPRQWKVIQHVREKFSCRSCESITQPPAPSHPIARGRAGPKLLAHVLFSKYCLHLPLNRQSAVYAREEVRAWVMRKFKRFAAHKIRARHLDACGLGRGLRGNADAAGRSDPGARVCGRAHPCRRHHRAGSGEG